MKMQVINSLRLKNFRAFKDTEKINFSRINIFVGPNNAGKSSIMSCVELILRSLQSSGEQPLDLREMPAFGSFDSVLRKHWSTKEAKAKEIEMSYELTSGSRSPLQVEFKLHEDVRDKMPKVFCAYYSQGDDWATVDLTENTISTSAFRNKAKIKLESPVYFQGGVLLPTYQSSKLLDSILMKFRRLGTRRWVPFEVVNAYRPVPRNYYVIDDPAMHADDRSLISFLAGLWSSGKNAESPIRKRIIGSLNSLGLTKTFEVKSASARKGAGVFELLVAPFGSRQKVRLAEAGFGLSQVLPLIVYDARLQDGALVAYQPEIHLHPAAQARLSDIFIASSARGNQVFVETHSVDLILRMQLLIAQQAVKSEDVALFFVENRSGQSSIRSVSFSDVGSPSMPFPTGFLDVSYNLAKDLIGARFARQKSASGK